MQPEGYRVHRSFGGGLRREGKRRVIVIAAAVLLILALAAGGTAYALFGLAATTVTITSTSRDMSNAYTLSAVTGTPDASRQQVGARLVSVTTPAQTKTVQASGHLSVSATQAKGMLMLRNWDTAPKTFEAGTDLPDWSSDEVVNCGDAPSDIVLDATVTVPAAAGSPTDYGVAYAPGHVLQPGASGNIPSGTGYKGCVYFLWVRGSCPQGWIHHCWSISPATDFTGGQDAYNGPIVQQSDINTAANSLISANRPDPQQVLQARMQPNERLTGTPQCTPNVTSTPKAGGKAAQVKVSVTFACTGEMYDHAGALDMAASLLEQQAAADPGGGYALVGKIKTTVIHAAIIDSKQGTVSITIIAEGVWAYQLSQAQQRVLASLIAGKSEREATSLLEQQVGVAAAMIQVFGAAGSMLPTDPQKIKIVVQLPPGA
jgi:hypothetical protein